MILGPLTAVKRLNLEGQIWVVFGTTFGSDFGVASGPLFGPFLGPILTPLFRTLLGVDFGPEDDISHDLALGELDFDEIKGIQKSHASRSILLNFTPLFPGAPGKRGVKIQQNTTRGMAFLIFFNFSDFGVGRALERFRGWILTSESSRGGGFW